MSPHAIVNEPPFGTPDALETTLALKAAVANAAARENEIEKSYRLEVARAEREHGEEVEALDAELQNRLAAARSQLHRSREDAGAKRERRAAWIARAHHSAERRVTGTVEGEKSRQISKTQAQTLEAKRERDTELAFAKGRLAELAEELRAEKRHFSNLRGAARAAFRGFPRLAAGVNHVPKSAPADPGAPAPDVVALAGELRGHLDTTRGLLRDFSRAPLPKLFRFLPLQWLAPIAVAAVASTGYLLSWEPATYLLVGGACLALLVALFALQRVAARAAAGPAAAIADSLGEAAAAYRLCATGGEAWLEANRTKLEARLQDTVDHLNENLSAAIGEADRVGEAEPSKFAAQSDRLARRNDERHRRAVERAEADHREEAAGAARAEAEAEAGRARDAAWGELTNRWNSNVSPIFDTLARNGEAAKAMFPTWGSGWLDAWRPPEAFAHAAPYGRLSVDLPGLAGAVPADPRLPVPGGTAFDVPLALRVPEAGSLLLETETSGDPAVVGAMNNIILRLLSAAPAGKLSFSIFDPVGLGQNFAGLTHLADYEDSVINKRIWTTREQIETRIGELGEHMEKVIQMYLRNEYETVAEYNRQAGNIAEKYHFLVVADFPTNFSEAATRGLMSIAASGARCGIYTIIHWDRRTPAPEALAAEDLRASCTCIRGEAGGAFRLAGAPDQGAALHLDRPPGDGAATGFVRRVGDASSDSNRIEVPFSHIMPDAGEFWAGDTTEELRVPIGRTGATKLQELAIGRGTRQHALFAGKTGSGKSTLFHVLVTNLALSCSPEQVEFYLVDFKKGVEFKCYASKKLPHARVVAIESDREFGLSVLQRLDEELQRRGELFREAGAQDLAGYRRSGGAAMPRSLLIIDEFQEFFVEDDRIAQGASVLLDRIVRQGRAFGIHALLGSQTLGGAYSLARATLGQMVIRVALMCNEADSYLIMDEGNPAPRLLTRPGEGIYNDSAGAIEGNSPFQTVWLPEDERDDLLDRVRALHEGAGLPAAAPVVFEGNAPADLAENRELAAVLDQPPDQAPAQPRIWLGAPNAIKGPTEAVFRRQSGNHLLVVGQRDDAIAAMLAISLVSLAAQFPDGGARIVLIDSSAPGTPERELLDRAAAAARQQVESSHQRDAAELITELGEELRRRGEDGAPDDPPVFVIANGLQRFKKLRYNDDLAYSFDASAEAARHPALLLNDLICEGAATGIHLVAAVDTFNNIGRTLSRKALAEFEMRVLFQMSANDSAALVDSTKASALGMHRALFYNEHEGYLETFRPYAAPGPGWSEWQTAGQEDG